MKKIFGLVCFFAFSSLYALGSFDFSAGTIFNLQHGALDEYVVYPNGELESELNWDLNNSYNLGITAGAGWKFIQIDSTVLWGIPGRSGSTYDSDWLKTNYAYSSIPVSENDFSMKTTYSISENTINSNLDFDIRIGGKIQPLSYLTVNPYFGYRYKIIEMSAENGYGWYGQKDVINNYGISGNGVSWNDSSAKFYDTLYGIKYKREHINYYIGNKITYNFLKRYSVSADCGISIYNQTNSIDHHTAGSKSKERYYLDQMSGYFSQYYFGADANIKIIYGLSAGLKFDYTIQKRIDGSSMKKDGLSTSKYTKVTTATSAAGGKWFDFSLYAKYSF